MTDDELPPPDSTDEVTFNWKVKRWNLKGISVARTDTDIRPYVRYSVIDGEREYFVMREVFLLFMKMGGRIPPETNVDE